MPILIVILGVGVLLLLIAGLRLHPFLSFVLVALGIGVAEGMDWLATIEAIQNGIGGTLGYLLLILGFGSMLGTLVANSGAALVITRFLTQLFGEKYLQWALMLTGFIVGIPMFYTVGFIVLVPLVFVIAQQTKLPLIYIGLPMLSALSVTHGYLPPHPAPTALVQNFDADLGLTLLFGLIVAIPAIILAGPVYSRFLRHMNPEPRSDLFATATKEPDHLPGVGLSLFSALLPVILIGASTIVSLANSGENALTHVLDFIGHPVMAMLIAVLVAIFTLGMGRGKSMKDLTGELNQSIKNIAPILLVIAGAGALKQVLSSSGVSSYLADALITLPISPLVLAWGMAALIRVCVGSATVAGLTTAGIILPLVQTSGASPELMVLATGAGSLMFSHVNDTGFWLFKEYFNLSIRDTLLSWSVMETIVSTVGLLGVLALDSLII